MPNPRYLAGTRFERTRKKFWEAFGWIVMRSSGSHGIFDLCAFNPDGMGAAMGIQCKIVATDKQAERLLVRFTEKPPLKPSVNYLQVLEVYSKESKKVWNILV